MKRCLFSVLVVFIFVRCDDKDESGDKKPLTEYQLVDRTNDSLVREAISLIKDGDLLLRTGNDFSSEQVKDFSQADKTFSHGGIAKIEGGKIFVYHVEPDYHYITDKVRKELIDSFFNPRHNLGIGVARYQISDSERIVFTNYLDQQYQAKIPFDIAFQLNTDDSMYCSEMIKKGLALATNNRINIEVQQFNDKRKYRLIKRYFKLKENQFVNREIIPIDRLFLNPACRVIRKFQFTQH